MVTTSQGIRIRNTGIQGIQGMAFWKRLRLTLEMIKFEHSVFALPFALTGALLAFRESHFDARAVRLQAAVDRGRHGGRALGRHGLQPPSGRRYRRPQSAHPHAPPPGRNLSAPVSPGDSCAVSVLVFLFAARALNPLCLKLAPLALAVVFFYSFTKRFTSFSHLVLGLLARHRAGGGLDRRRRVARSAHSRGSPPPSPSGPPASTSFTHARITNSTSREGLFSLPRRFGMSGALWIARLFHVAMIACLVLLSVSFGLGWLELGRHRRHRRCCCSMSTAW